MRARSTAAAAALGALGFAGAGLAQPSRVAVRASTQRTVFVERGRAEGLRDGMTIEAPGESCPRWVVLAAAEHRASLRCDGGALPTAVTTLALPPAPATPAVEAVRAREAPAPVAPWNAAAYTAPWPRVESAPRGGAPDGSRRAPTAGRVRGELLLRLLAAGSPTGTSRGYHDVGLSSQLEVDFGAGWTWSHLLDMRLAGSPELLFVPLQHATPRLDVYLLRAGRDIGTWALDLGRVNPAPGTATGLVDGARVTLRPLPDLGLSFFAGMRPDAVDGRPSLSAPRAGVSGRWSTGRALRLTVDATWVVDGWSGGIDRAFGSLSGRLDGRLFEASAEVVLDALADSTPGSGPRVTRALAQGRVRLLGGRLRAEALGGMDQSPSPMSLVTRWPSQSALPMRRFAWAMVEARIRPQLGLNATFRISDDDTGLWGSTTEVGAVLYDLLGSGSRLSARARWSVGELVSGSGATVGVELPFGRWLYANVSYGLDRWLFLRGTHPSWMHRARVAADRRFGRRWRMGLSAEVMTDAGASTQLLAMLMLGYRFGA